MPVVNLKYPDGRLESKNLISAIKKNGTEVVVVDLDFTDNGHKVMGVLHNSDGFYHNIIDQAKWDEIRGLLVDSIHGTLTDADYNIVGEINVSADPYRQLALKDDNFVSLSQNYEAFLSRIKPNEEVNVQNVEQSQPMVESPSLENNNEANLNTNEMVNQPVSEPISDVEINFSPVNPKTPNVENVNLNNNELTSSIINEPINNINEANTVITTPNPTSLEQEPVNLTSAPESNVNDNNVMMNDDSAVINNEPIVNIEANNEIPEQAKIINNVETGLGFDNQPVGPVNEPIVNEVNPVPMATNTPSLEQEPVNLNNNFMMDNETITNDLGSQLDMPVNNADMSIMENTPIVPENPQPIIDNVPLNVPPVGPVTNDTEAQQDTISLMDAPIDNPFAFNEAPAEPIINNEPVQTEASANDSIVTNAYMNGFEEIKIAMNQLVQESIERITNIGKEFNEKVDEYASKAKGSLQEASEYGKLLKDRFETTQNNINNMGVNPDMLNAPEEDPALKLAA